MRMIAALAAGLVFGLGLLVSDMANPARVLAFLDVGAMAEGVWDPTLAFVMAGAMAVSATAWALARKRPEAVCGGAMPGPARQVIDARLIGGSALFGIGWGLAGICPGPALTALGIGGGGMAVFVAAMLVGMAAFGALERRAPRAGNA
ncbi:hypothetical protein SAMN05444336_104301 [Albimonas donghaensis]|uniref:Sulphur transport domain-containing protein n=1 Tax=Albimonas donghaensis TaxID=356660 RepID=A0A1H3AST3_9RHOB|nr:DUF6691 family protein [Albimonas donghaensis]SDX32461.1 hypothetical protein SAMN05444336_104301 [Albimonas donghaensis]